MTTKQAIASYFLSTTSDNVSYAQVLSNRAVSSLGTTPKTVRNVLGILVSSGAIRRTANGYAARNKRILNSFVS